MKGTRLAAKIIKTLTKDNIHYPSRLYANIFIVVSRLGILLALYWYVFKLNNGVVNGVTYIVIAWSMFFYFIFSNFNLRRISRLIMTDVQSGNVEVFLNRPVSYLFYKIWWTIGLGLHNFVLIGVFGFLVLFLMIGIPQSMTIGIFVPLLILEAIFTIVLSIIIYTIVGLFAFWMEDINPVFWIVDKFIMILGGSYLPVALFPAIMYKFAIYSPFGASMFISHVVYDSWRVDWYKLMGMQVLWIVTLGLVLIWLFKKVQEKVSVNGG